MKKNSRLKFVLFTLLLVLLFCGLVAIPFILTFKNKQMNKINYFYNSYNDPYKELNMFAKSLDFAYDNKTNYEKRAEIVNNSVKTFTNNLANNIFKNNEQQKPTVLFIKNDSLVFNNDDNSKQKVNEFWAEQPILYSQIYAKKENTNVPGLNFFFPATNNNNSNSLFDDWFEIGASSSNSAYNKKNISKRIVSSWANTCDYVFYLYDSNVINNEQAFIDYVYYNNNSDEFWANKLLKTKAKCKNVIPIDMEWFYFGNWDQIGNFIILFLISHIFIDPKLCLEINLNKWDSIKWNSQIINFVKELEWNPKKSPWESENQRYLEKIDFIPTGDNIAYLATMYNLIGHSFSLGILPDYLIMFNQDKNSKKYNDLAGYLSWYKNNNYSFNFINQNDLSSISSIKSLKLYSLSANRDIWGETAIWPISTENNSLVLANANNSTEISNIVDVAKQLNIKPIYSERNDTQYTRSQNNEKIIFCVNNNHSYTIEQWIKENE